MDGDDDDAEMEENNETNAATVAASNTAASSVTDASASVAVDIDMTDIMVIDEYDSTKSTTTSTTSSSGAAVKTSEAAAPKSTQLPAPIVQPSQPPQLDERDRRDLEKRYKLPEHPRLIVHPSRTAKSGKFSCNVMSLSILLDYRTEDSKEHSFEVSLFAELFNEMLMRDCGFNIYKAMMAVPLEKTESSSTTASPVGSAAKSSDGKATTDDTAKEKADTSTTATKETTPEKAAAADSAVTVPEASTDEPKEKRSRRSDEDESSDAVAQKTASSSGRRRDDDETSLKSDSTRQRGRSDKSTTEATGKTSALARLNTTIDPDLLLSFVYFDTTHCGYIMEKDIEDLFYTLGLHLSRAQTRTLLARVVNKDAVLHYRRLTDGRKDDKDKSPTTSNVDSATAVKEEDENSSTTVSDASLQSPVKVDVETLARGNRAYLPIFCENLTTSETKVKCVKGEPIVTDDDANNDGNAESATDGEEAMQSSSSSTMVAYKGGFVDIEKLLDQMRRSEKARTDTEQLLVDLRKQNSDLTSSCVRSKEKIRDLQSDVKSYSRKLGDAEQSLSGTQVCH